MINSLINHWNKSENCALGLSAFGLLLCLVSLLFFQRDHLLHTIVDKISFEEEQAIGKIFFKLQEPSIVKEPEVKAQFDTLAGRLIHSIHKDQYEYSVFLNQDEEINAFAMPGGYIFVNTGLVKAADTPEEILGVIAHEMAHVRQRHVVKNLINSIGLSSLLGVLSGSEGIVGTIASNSSALLQQHYSRELESEADRVALDFLKQARISPHGLRNFFIRLKKQKGDATLPILSTHPAITERIDNLNMLSAEEFPYKAVNFDLKALKAAIEILPTEGNQR